MADVGSLDGHLPVLPALMPPVLAELAVMQPAKHVRVVVKPVGGAFHLIEVMAMVACGCSLLSSLAYYVQLFMAQLGDLG
jgi:hypothetical protein